MRGMRTASVFLFFSVWLLTSCSREPDTLPVISGATMGTTYSVQIPDLSDRDQQSLHKDIEAELQAVNDAMSTWQPNSSISQFNQHPDTNWFDVPVSFAEVALAALEIAEASDGAFDPTVGPLVKRWGFGSDQDQPIPPQPDELERLQSAIGYQHLQVRLQPPAVRKRIPGLEVDFSAIAKGYAVDRLAGIAEEYGYQNYLIEIGGELRIAGYRQNTSPWHIGVEQPAADGSDVQSSLKLTGGGVASSGDYRNFREAGGRRYSHIIDPHTGAPVTHGLASVTVVSNTAMRADGWATALMVLGAERGREYALRHSLAARFIDYKEGQFSVSSSELYDQLEAR